VMCKDNKKDVAEINADHLAGLKVIYVDRMQEVLEHALERMPVPGGIDLLEPVREAQRQQTIRRDDSSGENAVVLH